MAMAMFSGEKEQVKITHYINPHMFWYKHESSFLQNNSLLELESQIQTYASELINRKKFNDGYAPAIGETVLVLNVSWNKWVRACVDDIIQFTHDETKYIIWAIDHGTPFSATKKWIRPLIEKIANVNLNCVYYGGINNIVPAEMRYCFPKSTTMLRKIENWSPNAVNTISDSLFDTATVEFRPEIKIGEHIFGSIETVSHSGKREDPALILQKLYLAVETKDFISDMKEISTVSYKRFQNNDGCLNTFTKFDVKLERLDLPVYECDLNVVRKMKDWSIQNESQSIITNGDFNESASTIQPAVQSPLLPTPIQHINMIQSVIEGQSNITSKPSLSPSNLKDMQGEQTLGIAGSDYAKRHIKEIPLPDPEMPLFYEKIAKSQENSLVSLKDENNTKLSSVSSNTNSGKKSDDSTSPASGIRSANSQQSSSPSNITTSFIERCNAKKELADKQAKKSLQQQTKPKLAMVPIGYKLSELHMFGVGPESKSVEKKQQNNNSTQSNYSNRSNHSNNLKHMKHTATPEISNFTKVVENEACNSKLYFVQHRVLVHGHGTRIPKPIGSILQANFCDEVHYELQTRRYNQIYRIQSYSWPHIMRGNSLIVVNSMGTGKTIAYLPAICSLVKNTSSDYDNTGSGPLAIIICTSSKEVEKCAGLCQRFLTSCKPKMNIVQAYGVRDMRKVYGQLLSGCDILITTPLCLFRLVSESITLFDKKRLKHLIVENWNLVIDNCKQELAHTILKLCFNSGENKTNVQMIITSRSWHPTLMKFFKICNNPLLCIGAYIEAAVYAGTKFSMRLIKNEMKLEQMMKYLQKLDYLNQRTMIICNKTEEVLQISELLKMVAIFHTAITNDSSATEISIAKESNNCGEGNFQILLCTDGTLTDLDIKNITNIIHFSLPTTWTSFSYRFSACFDYYNNFLNKEYKIEDAKSIILLDEHNNEQLPRLIDFLYYHGKEVSLQIMKLTQKIRIQLEEKRGFMYRSLCPYIMSFGKCKLQSECQHRHVLMSTDRPSDYIPRNGQIKMQIINIVSPTHYIVRLMEHKPINGTKWTMLNRSNEFIPFSLAFSLHFSDVNNHISHYPSKVGDICAIADQQAFYRCMIIEKKEEKNSDNYVRVKFLDTGKRLTCKESELLQLPSKFNAMPSQAIDVRIVGIVPNDYELDWNSNTLKNVKSWLEDNKMEKMYVKAKIELSLMDTIWVDNLNIIEKLTTLACEVNIISIKETLYKKKFGVLDNTVVDTLKEFARAADILDESPHIFVSSRKQNASHRGRRTVQSGKDVSSSDCTSTIQSTTSNDISDAENLNLDKVESDKSEKCEQNEHEILKSKCVKEQWAKLENNRFQRVMISTFYHPGVCYIQNFSSHKFLQLLYDEIDKYAAIAECQTLTCDLLIGNVCLAKLDNKFNRAKILEVFSEENAEIKVKVFFVDFGQKSVVGLNEIIPISDYLVTLIPFQAILIKMIGIRPTNNAVNWDDNICDNIYDNILDKSINLFVRPMKETTIIKDDNILNFNSYDAVLIDCSSCNDINLNEQLVKDNYAEYNPETMHFIDIAFMRQESSIGSSVDVTDDENWDNCNYINRIPKPENSSVSESDSYNLIDACVEFTEDELKKLLHLPSTTKFLPFPEDLPESNVKAIECNNNDNDNQSLNSTNEAIYEQDETIDKNEVTEICDITNMSKLKYPAKVPTVIWQQSHSLICIKIDAPDIQNYSIKVTSRTLHFSGVINGELKILFLNLFGTVDNQYLSHEIRGLYVVVRLMKKLTGAVFTWPRLIASTDRCNWLKYNYDAIKVNDEQVPNTEFYKKPVLKCAVYSSSEDESDYEFYDGAINNDERLDPLHEDFQ